jgi:hypothetical protein
MFATRVLCLQLLFLVAVCAQGQNLVSNGTFPVASTDGWDKIGYSGGYVNHSGSAQGGMGDWINFTGTLSQDLNTIPGQWYVLSFATTGYNSSHGPQPPRLRVFLGTQLVALFVMPNSPPWFYPRFSFRAEGTPTRLTFDGFDYPNLDDVVVLPASPSEPRIQLVHPVQNGLFTANGNILLAAVADPAPNRTVRQVEFFRQGITRLGVSSTPPYTFNWTGVPAGEHVLSAKVTDSSGATMTSTGVTIVVAARPSVRISSPLSGTAFTNGEAVFLRGTVANNNGQITQVEFSSESNALERISNIPTNVLYDVSAVWSNAAEGNFSLSLSGTDALGQLITKTSVTIHVMPPAFLDASQTNHDTTVYLRSGFPYAQTFTPTINGRLRHLDVVANPVGYWDVPSMQVAIMEMSGNSPGTNILGISELPAWRIDPLTPATYSIYFPSNKVHLHAERTYAAILSCNANTGMDVHLQQGDVYPGGLLLEYSRLRGWAPPIRIFPAPAFTPFDVAFATHLIPNASPLVSLIAPEGGSLLTAGSTANLRADASDSDDGVARVEFLVNGAVLDQRMQPPFSAEWRNVPPGVYELQARVTDAAGYLNLRPS